MDNNKLLVDMTVTAIEQLTQDIAFFKDSAALVSPPSQKETLHGIYADKIKHKKYLMDTYSYLTKTTYIDSIQQSVDIRQTTFKQLTLQKTAETFAFISFIRTLLFEIREESVKRKLTEIILDCLIHAQMLQYVG